MGGAAVSSADTGAFSSGIELNANVRIQKCKTCRAIRGLVSDENPIVSIHDHGAGGHLNCLSELVEDTGGLIDLDKLPVGDPPFRQKKSLVTSLKKEWDGYWSKKTLTPYNVLLTESALYVPSR
jgi:phosphoribosylformylglycinamidine synthase